MVRRRTVLKIEAALKLHTRCAQLAAETFSSPAQTLRFVGHVSTGFSQAVAADRVTRLQEIEADRTPFEGGPRSKARLHWVLPELVADIEIAQWTSAGMLRPASFKSLRRDKAARAVMCDRSRATVRQDASRP